MKFWIEEFLNPLQPWVAPEFASPEGIVGVGGSLTPEVLLRAYRSGIFPWFNVGDPVIWWSPDPRAVLDFADFHIPRRLAATLRQNRFRVTTNRAFERVIRACGENRSDGTWVTDEMIAGYVEMNRQGHAHSLEVWLDDELAGGIYGVAVGALFAGESMFFRVRDASKVALVNLVRRLQASGFELFDLQILNDHTQQFGAKEIPRAEYLKRLERALAKDVRFV